MVQENNAGGGVPRELTGEEQALYDRQIRLWGADAQRRLSAGRILIVGDVTSTVSQELAKNVVLAGLAKITLCDTKPSGSVSFLGRSVTEVSKALQEMNPLVEVCTTEDPLAVVPNCDAVCSAGTPIDDDRALSAACHEHSVPFFSGRTAGFVGWIFLDLGDEYEYTAPVKKLSGAAANGSAKEEDAQPKTVQKTEHFTAIGDAVDASWGKEPRQSECGWHAVNCLLEFEKKFQRFPGTEASDVATMSELYKGLQESKKSARGNDALVADLAKAAHTSLMPVAAIVGGVWGRELVKVLSRRGLPLNNFFFFNARTTLGAMETIVLKDE